MLAQINRLKRSAEIRSALRDGRRSSGVATVVVVARRNADAPARVAVIAGKAVGNAVTRNLVKRRCRSIVGDMVRDGSLTAADVVVRAKPGAVDVPFAQLRDEVQRGLRRGLAVDAR